MVQLRWVVCFFALFFASQALANPKASEEAKARYDSGIGHYNLAEYKDALVDFKEAYRLVHDPALLFNIAQCYRQLQDPDQALTFYRAYRREAPNSPNRADIDRLIAEMEKAVQEKRAAQPPTGVQAASTARPNAEPHASPAPAANRSSLAPAPEAVVARQRAERPLVKKPWFWATVVGVAAVAATSIALGVVYGTQTRDPKATSGIVEGN